MKTNCRVAAQIVDPMNLQDATTRVRRAIEVITPEFENEPPMAFVKLSERVPGIFDVTLTDDDYLASIHDVTVRHVLGAQTGTITHEIDSRPAIGSFDECLGPRMTPTERASDSRAVKHLVGSVSGRITSAFQRWGRL
jgi:hypothetical protein